MKSWDEKRGEFVEAPEENVEWLLGAGMRL